jgi:putative spermidine/putrescine transport system permease protein
MARTTYEWKHFLLPGLVVLVLAFIVPQVAYLEYSFRPALPYGRVGEGFTLDNYAKVLTDPFYLGVMADSVYLSLVSVLAAALMGYPTAYLLARAPRRWSARLTNLLLLSSFVTISIKALGWSLLLRGTGPVNYLLSAIGATHSPVMLINNTIGAFIGMVHFVLPLMILTLAGVIQAIPVNLELAAHGMGASPLRTFVRVVFPLSLAGFLSALLMSFSLCMGLFATTALLGGGKVLTMPILIYQQVVDIANLPLGAALSVFLFLTVLVINVIAARVLVLRRGDRPREVAWSRRTLREASGTL